MEIKIEVNDGVSLTLVKVDISLYGMDAAMLPSLNGDEIREMVRPIIENKLLLETGKKEYSRRISRLLAYGEQRCRELFPEDFSDGEVPQNEHPQPPSKEEGFQARE